MTYNGSMPGPMMVVHEGDYMELTLVNPETNSHAAQHRLAFGDRRPGRRRADPGQSRRAGGAALEGDASRRLRLSLRAGRHDPLARRVGHARHGDGVAARRPEGRRRQAAALRQDLLHRRERSLRAEGRERQVQDLRDARRILRRHDRGHAQADPDPRRVQRPGRLAHRQERDDGQGRRDRACSCIRRPTATPARI